MYSSVSLANCLNHLENIYIKWFYYNTQCIEHEHVADVKKKTDHAVIWKHRQKTSQLADLDTYNNHLTSPNTEGGQHI